MLYNHNGSLHERVENSDQQKSRKAPFLTRTTFLHGQKSRRRGATADLEQTIQWRSRKGGFGEWDCFEKLRPRFSSRVSLKIAECHGPTCRTAQRSAVNHSTARSVEAVEWILCRLRGNYANLLNGARLCYCWCCYTRRSTERGVVRSLVVLEKYVSTWFRFERACVYDCEPSRLKKPSLNHLTAIVLLSNLMARCLRSCKIPIASAVFASC